MFFFQLCFVGRSNGILVDCVNSNFEETLNENLQTSWGGLNGPGGPEPNKTGGGKSSEHLNSRTSFFSERYQSFRNKRCKNFNSHLSERKKIFKLKIGGGKRSSLTTKTFSVHLRGVSTF